MNTMKILVTGGHPTPALACIDYIASTHEPVTFVFVGRQYLNEKERNDTYEYQEVTKRSIHFYSSDAKRGGTGIMRLWSSVQSSLTILDAEKPSLILSFGGYISLPVCLAAAIRRIPIYLHEQTAKPGAANRLTAFIAARVMTAFEEARSQFILFPWQQSKVTHTGNPIRQELLTPVADSFTDVVTPLVFINGGNMGSHALNEHVFAILPKLLLNVTVIHQVGNVTEFGDLERALSIQKQLAGSTKNKYIPLTHLPTTVMASALQKATMIVCRSGANTFFELVAQRKPAVLVPLPFSARGEQEYHAQIMADHGAAEIFYQTQPSEVLFDRIIAVLKTITCHTKAYDSLTAYYQPHAAETIWQQITSDYRERTI